MKINLSKLSEAGSHQSIEKELKLPDFNFRHQQVETPFPFHLKLDLYRTRDSYILSGKLRGKLVLTCSRCLEKFNYPVEIKIDEELRQDDLSEDYYDLNQLLVEDLVLAIPMKPVCQENCQGLCPVCGQNLNEGQCDCKFETIDPRLVKLKEFFEDD